MLTANGRDKIPELRDESRFQEVTISVLREGKHGENV